MTPTTAISRGSPSTTPTVTTSIEDTDSMTVTGGRHTMIFN